MPSCYADKRCDFPPAEAFVIQDRELCCQSQWAAITGAGSARNADICPWPHSSHLERGEIISTSHPESLFWDKKDIQMGFPGFSRAWCNLAHRVHFSFVQGLLLFTRTSKKATATPHFCVHAGYFQNYHLALSVFIPPSLLPRLVTPEEFWWHLKGRVTLCVSLGFGRDGQRRVMDRIMYSRTIFIVFSLFLDTATLSYFLVCVPLLNLWIYPVLQGLERSLEYPKSSLSPTHLSFFGNYFARPSLFSLYHKASVVEDKSVKFK